MNRLVTAAAVVLIGGTSAWAAPAAQSAAPATRPASTTRPAAPRAAPPRTTEDMRPRVLVMPFDELSDEPQREWVGKAIQQALIAELTRSGLVAVVTPPADDAQAATAAAVAELARDQHAPLAILGAYQIVGDELRVTGQMIESIEAERIAAIQADGSLRDLFRIEDQIAAQVRRDLHVILQPPQQEPSRQQVAQTPERDPFAIEPTGPLQQPPARGAYEGTYLGSDLQRSLYSDEWAPPTPPSVIDGRIRYTYDDPWYGYPPYSYYDWCGYRPWRPIYIRPVVPAGPGPSMTIPPNTNYNNPPGQMGRPSGNTNFNNLPGQMGRSSGNTNFNNPPGQMNRSSVGPSRAGSVGGNSIQSRAGSVGGNQSRAGSVGGNSIQSSPGQSGRSSGGNAVRNPGSR